MYAIVRTGGRQYRAEVGATIDVERLPLEEGDNLTIEDVLLLVPDEGDPRIGQPTVTGAAVKATCVKQYRAKKIIIWKYHPKKRYRLKKGHRQYYTRLRIEDISI